MKRIVLDIGTGLTSDQRPIGDPEAALDQVRDYFARTAGGYTEQAISGGWIDPRTDKVVTEPGRRFTIVAPDHVSADELARYAGLQLQQVAVMVEADDPLSTAHLVQAFA